MKEGTQGPRYLERDVLDSFLTFLLLSGRESTFLFASFSTVSSIVKAKASQPASIPIRHGSRAAILFLAYIYKHKCIRPTFSTMKVIQFYTAKVAPTTKNR